MNIMSIIFSTNNITCDKLRNQIAKTEGKILLLNEAENARINGVARKLFTKERFSTPELDALRVKLAEQITELRVFELDEFYF